MYTPDPSYIKSVENFTWLEHPEEASTVEQGNDRVVQAVATEIFSQVRSAHQIKPYLERIAQHEMSNLELYCVVIKDVDTRTGSATPEAIDSSDGEVKIAMNKVWKEMTKIVLSSPLEGGATEADVKAASLLFGIHFVKGLAAGTIVIEEENSDDFSEANLEKLESQLQQLVDLRSPYGEDLSHLTQPSCDFLTKVDQAIEETRLQINMIRSILFGSDKHVA